MVTGTQIATGHNLFLARAKAAFAAELHSARLRIAYERFYAGGEGDAELILEGFGLRLHLVRERSCDLVSVAGAKRPDAWHGLEIALHVLVGRDLPVRDPFVDEALSPDAVRVLIQTHAEALASALNPPWWRWSRTRERLESARRNAVTAALNAPKSEARKKFDDAVDGERKNPSPAVLAALKSMEDSNWGKGE